MELTSILSMVARIIVVSVALFLLSPLFAAANILVALLVFQVFGMSLRRQLVTQQAFKKQQFSTEPASSADKVRARIKAGELGALLASVGVMILMAVLIALTILGDILAGAALVSFLAVRMIGQMYSGISTGLMRFARARVNSD
jgi:predicted ABC-type exoprotein transport system permease subunit